MKMTKNIITISAFAIVFVFFAIPASSAVQQDMTIEQMQKMFFEVQDTFELLSDLTDKAERSSDEVLAKSILEKAERALTKIDEMSEYARGTMKDKIEWLKKGLDEIKARALALGTQHERTEPEIDEEEVFDYTLTEEPPLKDVEPAIREVDPSLMDADPASPI